MLFSHSVMFDFVPHGVQHARLPFTISQNLLKLISVELRKSSNHPVLSCPLLLLSSIFPNIRVFCSELAHRIRWPKYWCNSFSISPSNEPALHIRWPKYWSFSSSVSLSKEYSGFISLRIGWFYLLVFQGTLKSSLAPQFKSISSSAFSLLCGPTLTSVHDYWKNHSLDYMNLFQQSDVYAF